MVYSNWDYTKRRFEELPAGIVGESTLGHNYDSGKLSDLPDNAYRACGLGQIYTGYGAGGIKTFGLPTGAGDAVNFAGVLIEEKSNYRATGQPVRTATNQDMVAIIRVGNPTVQTTVAITDINAPVYCIHTADTGESPGQFKTSAGTNAFLVKNARWARTTTAAGVATLELLGATNPA